MIEIIPAVLPKSFSELQTTLERLRGTVTTVQVDVVDGIFAPNITWPYGKGGQEEFKKILAQEEGLPFWEEFDFEFDLMVKDARAEIQKWVDAGAARIVVHAKSGNARDALASLQQLRGEGAGYVSLGVALAADGSDPYEPFAELCDFVQVMGIQKVGFQGEAFDEKALEVIKKLRAAYPGLTISVDGGIRRENIAAIVSAGANHLVAGSLILSQTDISGAIREILKEANHTLGS
jgi:ribulose-phosphate 3-epimerase